MIIEHVRDYLAKELKDFNTIYNGPLFDTKTEKLMSIKRGVTVSDIRPIGTDKSTYSRLACNCIIHWTNSIRETETKSVEIRDFLFNLRNVNVDEFKVVMINIRNFVPIGSDENDIYEFAIDFEIIYKSLNG